MKETKAKPQKPTLYLAGSGDGNPPTFEDLMALAEKLKGRPSTPEELARARDYWEELLSGRERERREP